MSLPVLAYFFIFSYLPLAGTVVAFKNYNYSDGILGSPWNGFENFRYFFTSGKAFSVTKNTIMFNLIFIAVGTLLSVTAAILLSEMLGKLFRKTAQTIMFLPYFISWVTVGAFMYNFFNFEYGMINSVLKSFGMQALDIYSNPNYWYLILPALHVWKGLGFGSVIYLAAIMSIDQECYESASIDGANTFQRIFRITVPMIMPTMVILILLSIGRILRGDFDMFYQLIGQNGTLFDTTDIIDTLVFRSLVGTQDFGMASAAGLYQSVLCFCIIMFVNSLIKKYQKDYALF